MPALRVAKLARADRGGGGGGGGGAAGGGGGGGNVQHYTCSITMPFVFASLVITLGASLTLVSSVYQTPGSMSSVSTCTEMHHPGIYPNSLPSNAGK